MQAVIETLTPNEISKILRIHPFTVTRLAREGKLPAFSAEGGSASPCGGKVGGICLPARCCPPDFVAGGFVAGRFRRDEFEKWVAQRSKKSVRARTKKVLTKV